MIEKILIIDKNESAQKTFVECLQQCGYDLVVLNDLEQAQATLLQELPSLILCDLPTSSIQMLTASLRESSYGPIVSQEESVVPIIAVAHTLSAFDVVEALRAGAADFVLKPVTDCSAICDAIERQLERTRLYRLNQQYRQELETANRELKSNLEELRADQRAGRHIQLKLFPEPRREMNGLFFDHLIKPSLYLSGDFLDYIRIDERYVVFYLADVSGHGASSAFVTVLLKNLTNRLQRNLRRGSSDDLHDPQRLLERVNKELLETGLGKHLTMFAALLDTQRRVMTYTLGAHFPMPILKVGAKAEYLPGSGMPVGLFEDAKFATYELKLPDQFSLVVFSDGILEVLKSKGIAGKEEELLEKVAQCAVTVESLEEAFGLQQIAELPDDIAMMTITEATVHNVQL